MTVIAEKLEAALKNKKQNQDYIWKGPKQWIDNQLVQEEVPIKEATDEQLRSFYNHCVTMLYNKDMKVPGRYILLELIQEQRNKCNTELFLRYIENNYKKDSRPALPRFQYLQDIKTCIASNKEQLIENNVDIDKLPVHTFTEQVPEEFHSLNVGLITSGCLDKLGIYSKNGITPNFITKLGIWLSSDEKQEFSKEGLLNTKDILNKIRETLSLHPTIKLQIKNTGLNYKEFRAMITLKVKKYSELTTDQLVILRNKILFYLEEEVLKHIKQWEERIEILKEEAASRNITL